ncbi:Piwi domain-containing protein [Lasiosphaeria miniovina]|uniref:Piwi domain-containing protein n=1 Tax=Lasiosphaeria miniovina TaxID=1954250 RepID=A0AA40A5B1_9PEZI|nr:Piwi domain-containing protein [Lasiosphaeria miniovina]KAK0709584.1 Piwi domain-containing protein [Lasiosphaeria miniovina]
MAAAAAALPEMSLDKALQFQPRTPMSLRLRQLGRGSHQFRVPVDDSDKRPSSFESRGRIRVLTTPSKIRLGRKPGFANGKPAVKEAKGPKLAAIIGLALRQLPPDIPVATEYKGKVITLQAFDLPENGVFVVECQEPHRAEAEKWNVKFSGPYWISIDSLTEYLKTMEEPVNDSSFPKHLRALDALGIILGHTARAGEGIATVGRNRAFAIDDKRREAVNTFGESLLAMLRGYYQSVRTGTGRILVNTNVMHAPFRAQLELSSLFEREGVAKMEKIDQLQKYPPHVKQNYERQLNSLHKFLGRSRVLCKVPGDKPGKWFDACRSIAGLATAKDGRVGSNVRNQEAPKFAHGLQYGGLASVQFYLKTQNRGPPPRRRVSNGIQYNIKANLSLPLVNVGAVQKPIYFLAEHCKLLYGPVKAKMNPREQSEMIKFACQSPAHNGNSITNVARAVLGFDNNPLLDRFGVSVDKQLITVIGRELTPPGLAYLAQTGNSLSMVRPKNGGWLMKGAKISKPGRLIRSWTFLHISKQQKPRHHAEVQSVAIKFMKFMATNMGMKISNPGNPLNGSSTEPGFKVKSAVDEASLKLAFKKIVKARPDFVLVLLPAQDTALYNMVKKIADVDYGLQNACVVQDKILEEKGQMRYFANVTLKVNLKFGGTNQMLRGEIGLLKSGKTMVVGYDVTHPTNLAAGADKHASSMVGLVASVDKNLIQWPAVAWVGPAREEMLGQDLVEKFKSRLHLWQKNNQGRLPENILIFRDGVSEGQFSLVLEKELPHIREACKQTYQAILKPRITLIVSAKRHQTRFFPTDTQHIHPRSKNPKEGTVVDRGVTNVRYWDFFLQAHASTQGTARPAHYTVLLDEIIRADYGAAAADVLEKLTHDMCYLYGRATKRSASARLRTMLTWSAREPAFTRASSLKTLDQ